MTSMWNGRPSHATLASVACRELLLGENLRTRLRLWICLLYQQLVFYSCHATCCSWWNLQCDTQFCQSFSQPDPKPPPISGFAAEYLCRLCIESYFECTDDMRTLQMSMVKYANHYCSVCYSLCRGHLLTDTFTDLNRHLLGTIQVEESWWLRGTVVRVLDRWLAAMHQL